ncbi:unnamed protein product [Kuraishia capsulata CBS 1993]|uniref:SET domain-containing protein n=1 Tax=Kuraishia capsulata CBS 1993 TaxID=1382522 RepID=W6MSN7_9ASCO|nr:uncharacterized protein KUCA_T00005820001 [Kuraishia capsulata CBS 1993]CDK29826.1 unnamed protein product [Kuraishia capsulata CBS 1993]
MMFQNLVASSGAVLNVGTHIRQSPLGGWGMFYDASKTEPEWYLRVPKASTITADTILPELLRVIRSNPQLEPLIQRCVSAFGQRSEGQTLIALTAVLIILYRKNELDFQQEYIRVLLEDVNYVGLISCETDELMACYESVLAKDVVFGAACESLFSPEVHELSEFLISEGFETTLHDLQLAVAIVRSRSLEIPVEVDENSDDYLVDVSLVPILDFVNHANNPNCVFDVDRISGDVLLKPKPGSLTGHTGLVELSIQYDTPPYNLNRFGLNYGFFPLAMETPQGVRCEIFVENKVIDADVDVHGCVRNAALEAVEDPEVKANTYKEQLKITSKGTFLSEYLEMLISILTKKNTKK